MINTHEVQNQAPPREGVDEYATNVPLVEAVARWGRADVPAAGSPDALASGVRPSRGRRAEPVASTLGAIGRHVGSGAFQRDAEVANTHPPVLNTHDQWGNRIDEVEYDDAYHRIIAAS